MKPILQLETEHHRDYEERVETEYTVEDLVNIFGNDPKENLVIALLHRLNEAVAYARELEALVGIWAEEAELARGRPGVGRVSGRSVVLAQRPDWWVEVDE